MSLDLSLDGLADPGWAGTGITCAPQPPRRSHTAFVPPTAPPHSHCSAADAPPRGRGRRRLPSFDVKQMVAKTKSAAQWMHFAPSNLFTAEIAPRAQALLEAGLMETGIIGVEAWDEEIVSKVMQ